MAEPVPAKTVAAAPAAKVPPAGEETVLSRLLKQVTGMVRGSSSQLDIRTVNACLLAVICLLVVYGGITVFVSFKGLQEISVKQFSAAAMSHAAEELKGLPPLPLASFYQKQITQRNIFKRGAKPGDERALETGPSSKTTDMLKNLRLVGISWSDNPDIMIEDTKLGKTYFAKKGQMIGDFKVENVFKDKVVLRYNREVVELK